MILHISETISKCNRIKLVKKERKNIDDQKCNLNRQNYKRAT